MTVRPIVALGNPVLRNRARKVSRFDAAIRALVQDMIETMRDAPGVGLAAPQIGVPLQVAVVEAEKDELYVLVNPEIVKSEGEHILDEGCLSVPGFWGKVRRAEKVTVKARDVHGKEIRISAAEGLLGQALQHEIDHLNGMVYVDRLDSLDDLQRTSRRELRRESGESAEPAEPE
ncbi:MAG TPA: peptide deformylase [Chloroflexota bacterium]|nr:peptide deformylase [Chloroflexota bacterium]